MPPALLKEHKACELATVVQGNAGCMIGLRMVIELLSLLKVAFMPASRSEGEVRFDPGVCHVWE